MTCCSPPRGSFSSRSGPGLRASSHGPSEVDRMMAVQLLGTGGIAALLLAASATGVARRGKCRARTCSAFGLCVCRLRQRIPVAEGVSDRGDGNERCRPLHRGCDRRRRILLPRRHGRAPSVPRFAIASARADQGRQSRPRPRRARAYCRAPAAAAGAEADRRLAARAASSATVAQIIGARAATVASRGQ